MNSRVSKAQARHSRVSYPWSFKKPGWTLLQAWAQVCSCRRRPSFIARMLTHLPQCLRSCVRQVQELAAGPTAAPSHSTDAAWKHNELDYHMQKIDCFLLQDPEHYLKFRKYA